MKAVVLAGGYGTRLRPYLSDGINKHLVPVHDRPLLHHVLHTLAEADITEVLIAINGANPGLLLESIGDGDQFGLNVVFAYDSKPVGRGPAANIIETEQWVGNNPFLLMLGDSIYFEKLIIPSVLTEDHAYTWTTSIGPEWDDFKKYAQVLLLNEYVSRLERSEKFFSPIIQTGAWIFPPNVFDIVRTLFDNVESKEVRLTDVTSIYKQDSLLKAIELNPCAYIDCGTSEAIRTASSRLYCRQCY